jgi:hypothetical protein
MIWVLVLDFKNLRNKVKQLLGFCGISENLIVLILIHDANQIKHCNRSVDFKQESWLADICLSLLIEKTIVLNN